ncbi:CBS domain-containing protein [Candidatus Woesearchaeota archaeon]|nr:CBS domain-containing protein [Candidatus Woesearchaeota archaeon]
MKVKDIMQPITTTSVDSTVSDAARVMDAKNIGCLPVEDNGKITGIITERDILKKIVARGRNPEKTPVRDIMSSPVIKIDAEQSIEEANAIMTQNKIRRLLVESDGRIAGIITIRDVSNSLRYSVGESIIRNREHKYGRPSYGTD